MSKSAYIKHIFDNKKTHFIVGCLIGGLIFILIYGLNILSFTNTDWLTHSVDAEGLWDTTQHYLGWIFYRRSECHFPLGLADGLYTNPVSIVYTDSIPLFAFIFKLLSPLLPETFQYFGLFGLITYMLTGGFASLITARFCSNPVFSSAAAIITATSPVLTKRMFYHTALSAHFLILAAFALWIYRDVSFRRNRDDDTYSISRTYIALWSILMSLSPLINAYYTPMILGILLLSCLQHIIVSGWNRRNLILMTATVLIPAIMTGITAYTFGFFYGDVAPSTVGLDRLSFNLNQLFNPVNYLCNVSNYTYTFTPQNYSSVVPELPLISGWQEEGFSYLGLGMITAPFITVLLAIISRRLHASQGEESCRRLIDTQGEENCRAKRNSLSWAISLAVGLVTFVFLALSPVATFGDSTVYAINYPPVIYSLLSVFRSCGRFIWPVYYGIITDVCLCLALLYKRADDNISRIHSAKYVRVATITAMVAICVIQIIDISPSLRYKHDIYKRDYSNYTSPLRDEAWDTLGQSASRIMFYTPSVFGIECDPQTSCIFEEYALRHDLGLNVTYMSRDLSAFADARTIEHFKTRESGMSYPDIIYVFYSISDIPDESESHLNYYRLDGYVIGTEMKLQNHEIYVP